MFNRYIVASLFSHVVFAAMLLLTSFNEERTFPVFDVNIVGPLDEHKAAPVKPAPKPAAKQVLPPVREIPKRVPPAEVKPDTLYGQGDGVPPAATEAAGGAKKGDIPLTPLDGGESGPPAEKGPSLVPPSALFDEKVIEKFAMKETPPNKGLTFDTSEFRHRGYMKLLKEKIENIWQYPKEAARLGLSGDLYIKFSIKKDGRLGDVEVLRTSGYKELDEAAVKALKDAEPYWPLPADWEKNVLEIKGHFIYVYGSAVVM